MFQNIKISENNEWVATLINQLAEIRSQLETGNSDYEYEWQQQQQQHQQHQDDELQQQQQHQQQHQTEYERLQQQQHRHSKDNKISDWLPRSQRLRRQIGGLLENCGCPAGPPGPPGTKGRKGKKGKNALPGRPTNKNKY